MWNKRNTGKCYNPKNPDGKCGNYQCVVCHPDIGIPLNKAAVIIDRVIEEINILQGIPHQTLLESIEAGIIGVLRGNSSEESHAQWCEARRATGWVYGMVKDVKAQTHPCLVPYNELAIEDKIKDCVMLGVTRAMKELQGL